MELLTKRLSAAVLALLLISIPIQAQNRARITRSVDNSVRTVIHGSVHPLARAEFETGRVDPNLALDKMILQLSPGPGIETAMHTFIDSLHTPGSPDFQHWITPDEFGQRFGAASEDISKVTAWLSGQGLRVESVARGGLFIVFSGTAGQVETAFQTDMRRYRVHGEDHIANAREISVPAALAPAVQGVVSLNDFFSEPIARQPKPEATFPFGNQLLNVLSPGDFASIYNLNPLYQAGFNGSGQTIAVLERSDFLLSDYQNFRTLFNLPPNTPNVILVGEDPGTASNTVLEATLDPQWAGGVAPGATIDVVTAASTAVVDGVALAAEYAVENNFASVISVSFADCEQFNVNAFYNAAWAQAAAQGISVVVGAGDTGAADCDATDPSNAIATHGLAVSGIASTPYDTAIGGSEFDEAAAGGNSIFWNTTNGQGDISVRGYIPEMVWNESCNGTAPNSPCPGQGILLAGAGGASFIYSKPSWQTLSIPGVPQDGARDLPDISLTAAVSHDPYLICFNQSCQNTSSPAIVLAGGTSFAAPAFAGIMAIVDQKLGGRQGLANYVLYALAAKENFSNCNSSSRINPTLPPSPQCPFNDITVGNNSVPGQPGFNAGVGYDLASGLGSVNATVLADQWASLAEGFKGTQTTLSASIDGRSLSSLTSDENVITHGQGVLVVTTVTSQTGRGTPTGSVAIETSSGDTFSRGYAQVLNGTVAGVFPLDNGASGGTVNNLPGGSYNIFANYPGDGLDAGSVSNQIPITVNPEDSNTNLGLITTGLPLTGLISATEILPNTGSVAFGFPALIHAFVSGFSGYGFASGTITFFDNGQQVATLPLNSYGEAELDLCFNPPANCPTVGVHLYTTIYSGDNSFVGSRRGSATLTVTGPPPPIFTPEISKSIVSTQ